MADIVPGIYLEIKKVTIGVGSTAKSEEYRTHWMTTDQKGGMINAVLLDDNLKLTGVRNAFLLSEFQSGRFNRIPESDEVYPDLILTFAQSLRSQPAKQSGQTSPTAKPSPENPSKPAPSQAANPAKSTNGAWWEGSQRNLTVEDIFGNTGSRKAASTVTKNSRPETNLKKSWWDK